MITIRRLDKSEFGRLRNVADGLAPNPDYSRVIVIERDGEIVGRMCLMTPVHIEGTWLREDVRRGTVGFRMFQAIEREATSLGVRTLLAYATSAEHETYLQRLGFGKLEFTVWSKEIKCQ